MGYRKHIQSTDVTPLIPRRRICYFRLASRLSSERQTVYLGPKASKQSSSMIPSTYASVEDCPQTHNTMRRFRPILYIKPI